MPAESHRETVSFTVEYNISPNALLFIAWEHNRLQSANDVPSKSSRLSKTLPPLTATVSPAHSPSFNSGSLSRPSTSSHTVVGSGREAFFPSRSVPSSLSATADQLYGHDDFSGPWMGSRNRSPPIPEGEERHQLRTASQAVDRARVSREREREGEGEGEDNSDIQFIDSGSVLSADELNSSQETAISRYSAGTPAINQFDVENFVRISSPPKSLILAGSATFVLFNHGSEVRIHDIRSSNAASEHSLVDAARHLLVHVRSLLPQ